ncbi:MAG: hypothetical protein KGL35_29250 [Bradyrhizobium sp.]|nr:hypothetical protein [Bradyrhizobium sp.]
MMTFFHMLWANKDVGGLLVAGLVLLAAAGYFRTLWPCLIALPCLALAVGIIIGNVRGFKQGANAARTVVEALQRANIKLSNGLDACQTANEGFAAAAKVSQAEQERAKAQLVQQHKADVEALKSSEKRLDEAIHANKNAATWAAARVPDSIVQVLRDSSAN